MFGGPGGWRRRRSWGRRDGRSQSRLAPGPRPTAGDVRAQGEHSVAASVIERSIIVSGDRNNIEVYFSEHGDLLEMRSGRAPAKQPVPTPVLAREAPFADHVDRQDDASRVLAGARTASPVNVYGEAGIGKSYLLTFAANQPDAEDQPDGIVSLDGHRKGPSDLLQALWREFYDVAPGLKPGDSEIQRDLRDKRAVVFVDDFGLDRDEAQRFFRTASRCRFIVASQEQSVWQGTPIRLAGLGVDDAMLLVQSELGRSVTDAERPAAEAIHQALGGNPGRIRPTISATRQPGSPSLEEVALLLAERNPVAAVIHLMLESSSTDERRVLRTMAVFGSAPLDVETVRAITGVSDIERVLSNLETRGIIRAVGRGFRLSGVRAEELEATAGLGEETAAAAAHLASWAEAYSSDTDAHHEKAAAFLAVLRSAGRHGLHAEVIRIGKAISAAIALSLMWGAWEDVLEAVLISARRLADRDAEGWALHQLGTRRVAVGDRRGGLRALRQALEVRQAIGDSAGEEATRHNLEQARRRRPLGPLFARFPGVVLALAITTLLAGGAALWAIRQDDAASLSLAIVGEGIGTVISAPAGIDCGATCGSDFDAGTEVALSAVAVPGSVFAGWQGGGCVGVRTCTLRLVESTSITAEFRRIQGGGSLEVVRTGTGNGTVTSSPTGIDCGATCRSSFAASTLVTLTATAHAGTVFVGWEGGACAGSTRCDVLVNGDASVRAVFRSEAGARTLRVTREGEGRGMVTSSPAGIDCGVTCTASFAAGTRLILTTTAESGSVFEAWDGGGCSGRDRCTLSMDSDTSVHARFRASRDAHLITVIRSGSGAGMVSSSPAGIDCGQSCAGSFASGSQLTLIPTAQAGSVFTGWTGMGCSGTGSCTIIIGPDTREVTAVFTRAAASRSLVVSRRGSGQGTVTSAQSGIDCGPSCTASVADGAQVVLTAAAERGSAFAGWSHPACAQRAQCTVDVRQDTAVTATFDIAPTRLLTVTSTGDGVGTVTSSLSGIACPPSCKASFPRGTEVTLTAAAGQRAVFAGWNGGQCSGSGSCRVVLTEDTSLTARFEFGYVLTVTVTNGSVGDVTSSSPAPGAPVMVCNNSCTATFREGASVTLTAKLPAAYYASWEKGCTEIQVSCTVAMTSDKEVSVRFLYFG